jgi:thiosulfate dehydrogenase
VKFHVDQNPMRIVRHYLVTGFLAASLYSPACAEMPGQEEPQQAPSVKFAPPDVTDIPNDENRDHILLGRRLLAQTKKLLPENVGNGLNCTNCHLGEGRIARALPYFGVSVNYPKVVSRAGRSETVEERINGCFLRSMNGKELPVDSPEMSAMVAYLNWLSTGLPQHARIEGASVDNLDMNLVPDPGHGKSVYEEKCARCHGTNGQGLENVRNEFVIPPLWGDQSFNIGSGMARTYTAAGFVKNNMPLGQAGPSDQEAIDVAEYFTHQPRPDFPPKVNDWPNGGKPKDARY